MSDPVYPQLDAIPDEIVERVSAIRREHLRRPIREGSSPCLVSGWGCSCGEPVTDYEEHLTRVQLAAAMAPPKCETCGGTGNTVETTRIETEDWVGLTNEYVGRCPDCGGSGSSDVRVILSTAFAQIGWLDDDDPRRPPYVMPNRIVPHWQPVYVAVFPDDVQGDAK